MVNQIENRDMGDLMWVRNPAAVREKWEAIREQFNVAKRLEADDPNQISEELEFFEIPKEFYAVLPNLPDFELGKIKVLLQRIGSLPYAQTAAYQVKKKLALQVAAWESLSESERITKRGYFEEGLSRSMIELCQRVCHSEEATAELKAFIDQILQGAGAERLYNVSDPYAEIGEQVLWNKQASVYSLLPAYAQLAVNELVEMYKSGKPVAGKYWDDFLGKSNLVDFRKLTEPKEKFAAVIAVANTMGKIKNNRQDERLPVIEY